MTFTPFAFRLSPSDLRGKRRGGVPERRPLRQALRQPDETGIGLAPIEVGKPQIQVAERARYRDVGQAVSLPAAPVPGA